MKLNLDKADWIELAIIVVSGLAILYSIPEILYKLTNYVYFNDFERNNRHFFWTGKNKADIFYSVFKFVIGLFSVLNARNFSRRLVKIGDKDDRLIA